MRETDGCQLCAEARCSMVIRDDFCVAFRFFKLQRDSLYGARVIRGEG